MIDKINRRFSAIILKECNGKKVGMHLSGGFDTRSILSILLKNNIKPLCYTYDRDNDIDIAKSISNRFGLKHKILEVNSGHDLYNKDFEYDDVDIVFSGLMMSEYLNFYQYLFNRGFIKTVYYKHIPNAIYDINEKIRCPIIDKNILDIVNNLPFWKRRNKIIQRYIINKNYPELLNNDWIN